MDYKALAEQLVKDALKLGADAAEVYMEAGRELSIEIRNGEVETVQESAAQGAGIRVLRDNRLAFASCNDFTEGALGATVKSAVRMAGSTTPDKNNVLPGDSEFNEIEGLYDPEYGNILMEKKIAMAKEVEALAIRDRRITKSAGAGFSEAVSETIVANSSGLLKSYKDSGCYLGVSVVAEKGDQKCSGAEYCSRRLFSDLDNADKIAKKAAKDAYEMLDPRMVKTQRAPVVFDPDVARSILGGVLGAIDGKRVLQGASFLADKKDQKIAAGAVTLIDDGLRPKGMASRPFDGEGVATQRRVIVEQGVLKGFLYNAYAAARAGVESTGNASRGGFTSLPGIGCHNFYMDAGKYNPQDIIGATRNGLYLKGVTGYGINPVNGNFSGGASGFWIENGRIAFPVKGLTIAGSAFDMLAGIDMVGDDLDLNRSFTAPTFRIKEMQIGGE